VPRVSQAGYSACGHDRAAGSVARMASIGSRPRSYWCRQNPYAPVPAVAAAWGSQGCDRADSQATASGRPAACCADRLCLRRQVPAGPARRQIESERDKGSLSVAALEAV